MNHEKCNSYANFYTKCQQIIFFFEQIFKPKNTKCEKPKNTQRKSESKFKPLTKYKSSKKLC